MTLITATATKDSAEAKLGIAFTRGGMEEPLVVKMIREGSLFEGTELRAGMIVDTVQGEAMTWKTPKDAADILRDAPAGPVTITSQVFVGKIVKESADAKVGIALKNSTSRPGIFVSKVNEDGAFANTELQAGQKVLTINDTPCPETTKEAIALVKQAEAELTLLAIPTDLAPPSEDAPEERPEPASPEEKKDEHEPVEEVVERSEPKFEEAEEEELPAMEEKDKGIIDKMFAACIC